MQFNDPIDLHMGRKRVLRRPADFEPSTLSSVPHVIPRSEICPHDGRLISHQLQGTPETGIFPESCLSLWLLVESGVSKMSEYCSDKPAGLRSEPNSDR
jgi:hypothetical protein